MHFFLFIVGSAGLFGFLMFLGLGAIETLLEQAVTAVLSLVGSITGIFAANADYSMITVYHRNNALTFFVDYECSGYIEMLVYACLLAFFPLYSSMEKLIYSLGGLLYIFLANVGRVFLICGITKIFGSTLFFFSHTIFARLLFFALMVILYYFVFTRPHIKRQKVGNMSYAE